MKSELYQTLLRWPGRQETQARMEAIGYRLPQEFTDIVLEYVPGCDELSLQRYWDEVAREELGNPPADTNNRRQNPGAFMNYRSAFLDELAELPENRLEKGPILSLHPGYKKFCELQNNIYNTTDIALEIFTRMERAKAAEIRKLKVDASGWLGIKQDASTFLAQVAEHRGFKLKRKCWHREFCENLEFVLKVDKGRRFGWRSSLSLMCSIVHKETLEQRDFEMFPYKLLPGFVYYERFKTPASAVLGVHAFVDLFATIGELLEEALEKQI